MAHANGGGRLGHEGGLAEQASLLARDLRTLIATLDERLILFNGAEDATQSALRTAKETAERALSLADQLLAIAAKRTSR